MRRVATFLVPALLIAGTACNQPVGESDRQDRAAESNPPAADNTARNVRDRNDGAVTPLDQGNNEKDLRITRQIRQSVTGDAGLSFDARNIKIITLDSVVTLRGPVESDAEKAAIAERAQRVEGVARVDNQLDVKRR
jgi:osmotically-inducible protein OsmY